MKVVNWSILVVAYFRITFGCPDGWIPYRGQCYFISHDQEPWVSAEAICMKTNGAYLAEIDSDREFNFLQHTLVDIHNKKVWVGGTDVGIEGDWFWSHSKIDIESPHWIRWTPGEPNSYNGKDENCMDLRPGHNGVNDETCTYRLNYICEVHGP